MALKFARKMENMEYINIVSRLHSLCYLLSVCFQCWPISTLIIDRQIIYLLKNCLSSSLIMPNPFPWKSAWQSLPIRVPAHPTSLSCWIGRSSLTIMLWSCSAPRPVRISPSFWSAVGASSTKSSHGMWCSRSLRLLTNAAAAEFFIETSNWRTC